MATKPPVIISTDYGLGISNYAATNPHAADTDDAYAVTLALQKTAVQTIVTIFGNSEINPTQEQMAQGIKMGLLGLTPAKAAKQGLSKLGFDADIVTVGAEKHGPGYCDNTPYIDNKGVNRMQEVLDDNISKTVTLFAIGPLTDVASLQHFHPDSFNKLKEIIVLAGSFDGGLVLQGIPVPDFNFAKDPIALGQVITNEHSVPVTCLMFEVSKHGTLKNRIIDTWANGIEPRKYYGTWTKPHAKYWDNIFKETAGQALFDAHTVYYFLNPDQYLSEENMLATVTVGGDPDTNARTTKNFFTVEFNQGNRAETSVKQNGAKSVYSGPVRGCYAFSKSDGLQNFEQAVKASVTPLFE